MNPVALTVGKTRTRSLAGILAFDGLGFLTLTALAVAISLVVNSYRAQPLPLWGEGLPGLRETDLLPELTADRLLPLIHDRGVVVIDVRPPAFFELGHIAGAVSLPFPDLQEGRVALPFPREARLVVYCADVSCPAARSAALLLQARGFRQVSLFSGGWFVWKREKLPMETGS